MRTGKQTNRQSNTQTHTYVQTHEQWQARADPQVNMQKLAGGYAEHQVRDAERGVMHALYRSANGEEDSSPLDPSVGGYMHVRGCVCGCCFTSERTSAWTELKRTCTS